jgi:superfamily II DNA/RNA helicase
MTSTDTLAATEGGIESAISSTSISSSPASSNPSEVRFEDLGLGPQILKAVADSGYVTPTPIQARGIPKVLAGKDIIGIAQTGTGKTASFTLPMIEILGRGRAKARMPRTLILEPTRELAAQVAESFERYGKYSKLSMALLIGGVSFDEQDKKLDRGVDVLIATPGRLLDHFERGKLMLTGVQILVIDEADRMLDMGFIPDVERIAKLIPFTRQTLFYSATMPPEIQRLTDQFLQAPVRIEVSRPATAASTIVQTAIEVPGGDWSKRETLRRLIREHDVKNAIVFCNRKRDVDVVAKSLTKHGFSAAPLHGDLDQSVRTKTLDSFRAGEISILVASDVAARGLDIPSVGHIFNFDVPFQPDDYVHRIGRTGRAGRSGHALMLVNRHDEKNFAAIEKLIGAKIERRVMEGLPEELPQREHGPRSDRARGRGRDRSRRRGGEARPREHVETRAHQEHVEAAIPAEPARPHTDHAAKPREQRQHRSPEPRPQQQQPKHQTQHQTKPQQTAAQKPRDMSEFPAFLLRPVKLPAKPAKASEPQD